MQRNLWFPIPYCQRATPQPSNPKDLLPSLMNPVARSRSEAGPCRNKWSCHGHGHRRREELLHDRGLHGHHGHEQYRHGHPYRAHGHPVHHLFHHHGQLHHAHVQHQHGHRLQAHGHDHPSQAQTPRVECHHRHCHGEHFHGARIRSSLEPSRPSVLPSNHSSQNALKASHSPSQHSSSAQASPSTHSSRHPSCGSHWRSGRVSRRRHGRCGGRASGGRGRLRSASSSA